MKDESCEYRNIMVLKAPPIKVPNIREIVPIKINEFISLNSFKKEIRIGYQKIAVAGLASNI